MFHPGISIFQEVMENFSLNQSHKEANYYDTDEYVTKHANDTHNSAPQILHVMGLIEQPFNELHTTPEEHKESNNYNQHILTSKSGHLIHCIVVVHHMHRVHLVNHVCGVHLIHDDKMCCIHSHNLFVMSII